MSFFYFIKLFLPAKMLIESERAQDTWLLYTGQTTLSSSFGHERTATEQISEEGDLKQKKVGWLFLMWDKLIMCRCVS